MGRRAENWRLRTLLPAIGLAARLRGLWQVCCDSVAPAASIVRQTATLWSSRATEALAQRGRGWYPDHELRPSTFGMHRVDHRMCCLSLQLVGARLLRWRWWQWRPMPSDQKFLVGRSSGRWRSVPEEQFRIQGVVLALRACALWFARWMGLSAAWHLCKVPCRQSRRRRLWETRHFRWRGRGSPSTSIKPQGWRPRGSTLPFSALPIRLLPESLTRLQPRLADLRPRLLQTTIPEPYWRRRSSRFALLLAMISIRTILSYLSLCRLEARTRMQWHRLPWVQDDIPHRDFERNFRLSWCTAGILDISSRSPSLPRPLPWALRESQWAIHMRGLPAENRADYGGRRRRGRVLHCTKCRKSMWAAMACISTSWHSGFRMVPNSVPRKLRSTG